MVTVRKKLDRPECTGQVAQSRDSFYNKQRNRTLQSCSRQKVDEDRPLARIKEAHEVEQDWPGFNGLGSVRSDGSRHDGVRWRHDWVHVGSWNAVQPDRRLQDR